MHSISARLHSVALLTPSEKVISFNIFSFLYDLFELLMLVFSLMNNSDKIRWSLDLRWQRADRDVGFYDLKQGVRMRSSTDPNLVIDWDSFNAVTRHVRQSSGLQTTWHAENEVSSVQRDDAVKVQYFV